MIDLEKKVIDPEVLETLEMAFRNNEMSGFVYSEEEKERLRQACTSQEALDAEMDKYLQELGPEIYNKLKAAEASAL